MGDSQLKEVNFETYCPICKYWNDGDESAYCDECLEESMREGTRVPLRYEAEDS